MGRHLVSKAATQTLCAKCGAVVLDGLDEGMPFRLNPLPVNPYGEVRARMTGRTSYRHIQGGHFQYRDAKAIRGDEFLGRPLVLAAHVCGPVVVADVEQQRVKEAAEILSRAFPATAEDSEMHRAVMEIANQIPLIVIDDEAPPF